MTRDVSRQPRDLRPSRSLLRALHRCQETKIARLKGQRNPKPTVSLSVLKIVEDLIQAKLHDDVLTLLAVADPVAQLVTGIHSQASVDGAAESYDAPDGYVCISAVYSDPVGEHLDGSHGAAHYVLFAPTEAQGPESIIQVKEDSRFLEPCSLGKFMDDMLHNAWSEGYETIGRTQDSSVVPQLASNPRLVAGTPAPKPQSLGFAKHKKFGTGKILRRIDGGETEKLVVAFEDSERTLLARFVEIIEDA